MSIAIQHLTSAVSLATLTTTMWNENHKIVNNLDLGMFGFTANYLICNHATAPTVYWNVAGSTKFTVYWDGANMILNPGTTDAVFNLSSGKSIRPYTTGVGDLGSNSQKFNSAYFSGNIYMNTGSLVDNIDVSYHASGTSDHHTNYVKVDGTRTITGDITILKADAQLILRSAMNYRWSIRIDGNNDEEFQIWDLLNNQKRESFIYNAVSGQTNMSWFNCDGALKGYMTYAGNFYADGSWLTFSPDVPDELDELKTRVQSEIKKEKIKRTNGEALCVCGELLKDCKLHSKEVQETYAKDVGFLAAANSKIILNLLERIEELESKVNG